MKYRTLGATGLNVSEIALGCSELGRPLVYRDAGQWIDLLHGALDLGVNFFDTSNSYRYGMSERLLGRAFRGRRDDVVICTKAGSVVPAAGAFLESLPTPLQRLRRRLNPPRPSRRAGGGARQDFSVPAITASVEGSLRRLGTDRIDVLLLHSPSLEVVQDPGIVHAMERLVGAGKIRFWGVSAESLAVARHASTLPGLSVMQLVYSLMQPEAGDAVIEPASRRGIGIVARLVLARGLLTSKQEMCTGPRTLDPLDPDSIARRTAHIGAVATESGRPVYQAAIQFVLANPEVGTALIGTTQAAHLAEAAARAGETALSDDRLRRFVSYDVPGV